VVARVTGFSLRWIEKLVARWNAEGRMVWAIGVAATAPSRFSMRRAWLA